MNGAPSFSVIIPTFNRPKVLGRTLQCLADLDYPASRYEVLVADNSTDGTPDLVRAFSRQARCDVRLLSSSERLPAVKRNRALREAKGEYIVFLNDDVWVAPDFLRQHLQTHRDHAPEPVAVLGRIDQSTEMPATPFIEWYQPFPYHELEAFGPRPLAWNYFWAMNISAPRRALLERNLLFHEDWAEIGSEDVELGWRWTQSGLQIFYNPAALADHYHPHTLDSACRLQESIGRGLRDLEQLAPAPGLLDRYGVFAWSNPPRSVLRGIVRQALFNATTEPWVRAWLNSRRSNNALTRWLYWKVLLHHTNRGYRAAPVRPVRSLFARVGVS